MPAPAPGTVIDGYRFKGGDPNQQASWERVEAQGPRDRPDWGPGASELPDGSIVRYGPRGGLTVLQGPTGVSGNTTAAKLTEDQGKAQTYARLQADAERSYRSARRDGYNPASFRNATAAWFDGIPGVDGLGPFIRDEVSDRGRQAEMQWTDAQLKAVSGAASPEAEVRRNVRTYFPAFGADIASIEPQMARSRATAFEAARTRAGPGARDVRPPLPLGLENSYQRLFDSGKIDRSKPAGDRANPYVARTPEELDRFRSNPANAGRWVMGPDGRMQQTSSRRPAPVSRAQRPTVTGVTRVR